MALQREIFWRIDSTEAVQTNGLGWLLSSDGEGLALPALALHATLHAHWGFLAQPHRTLVSGTH